MPTDTKQTRVVKISVPTESFFNFFAPPQPPTDDDDDESIASDIEERLELDYQLGEDIKEKLIPRAIDWFTGEALQFEELGEEIDPDEFEDEDDEDEDEDDEDDQESDRDVEDDSDEEVFMTSPLITPFLLYALILICLTRMVLPSLRRRLLSASKTRMRRTEKKKENKNKCWSFLDQHTAHLICFMDFSR